jgi:hypothetical protein
LTSRNTDILCEETAGPIPIEFNDSGSHRLTNKIQNTDILCEETAGPIPIEFGDSSSQRLTNTNTDISTM